MLSCILHIFVRFQEHLNEQQSYSNAHIYTYLYTNTYIKSCEASWKRTTVRLFVFASYVLRNARKHGVFKRNLWCMCACLCEYLYARVYIFKCLCACVCYTSDNNNTENSNNEPLQHTTNFSQLRAPSLAYNFLPHIYYQHENDFWDAVHHPVTVIQSTQSHFDSPNESVLPIITRQHIPPKPNSVPIK